LTTPPKTFGAPADKADALAARFEALGIREDDLQERFIRASGPGGQHVNKTESAVFLRHVPSGIEVKVQTERSQSQNRFTARWRLADKIEALREAKRRAAIDQAAKIQRQNRRKSRRAKERMLADKRKLGAQKRQRKKVGPDE
jgi:protein subunit release factor B